MPNLTPLMNWMGGPAGLPVLVLVILGPVAGIVLRDWRATLVAWLLQSLGVVVLLSTALPLGWALLYLWVAALNAVMWFLSARTVSLAGARLTQPSLALLASPRRSRAAGTRALLSTVAPFRALAVILVAILFGSYAGQVHLPDLDGLPATLALWLMVTGLLAVALSEEPLKGGTGILTALAGFMQAYVAQQPPAAHILMLSILALLIGLAVAYLIVAAGLAERATPGATLPRELDT